MTGGTTTPSEGVNVHIKDGHISIVIKEDDTYTVAHQGKNRESAITSDTGVSTHEYSATYTYNSKEAFERSFWGNGVYYSVK